MREATTEAEIHRLGVHIVREELQQEGWILLTINVHPKVNPQIIARIAQYAAIHADQQQPVAVFSLEMSKEQLVTRLLCSEARIDASRLRTGHLIDSDWDRLARGAGNLHEAKIFIDASTSCTRWWAPAPPRARSTRRTS